jgi:5-methylcytosine-specific restriction endonuclease McrA
MSEHTQQTATQDDAQFQITESDLKADLRRVKLELGETPSYGDYDQHGAYSFTPIRRVFGCWSNALAAVGFDTDDRRANTEYTDEELLDAIRELAAEVEGAPTARDMNKHGRHSNQIYYNRFGSWTAALSKAGVEKEDDYVSAGSLIDAILDVACEVGRSPYGRELDELTDRSQATCKNRFGSWAEALQMAGLPPRYRGGNSTKHRRHNSYGRNWREMRRRALERDRYECQDCGVEYAVEKEQTGNGLHVHHICPIRAFDEPEQANFLVNLISLCEECHQKWERSGPTEGEIEEIVAAAEAGGHDE